MTNVRRLGVAAVAGMMCVAGCGGGSKTDVPPSTISSTEQRAAAPSRAAQDLVLTAAELPPGLTVMSIGTDEKQVILGQLVGSADRGATFSPAECGLPSMFVASAPVDVSALGVVVGEAGQGYFNEAVVAQRPALDELRRFFGNCKTVREAHADTSIETTYTLLEGLRPKADDLVVVEEKVSGALAKQDAYIAYGAVGGYAVWVRMRTVGDGAPDRALFDQLATAAINKVADAS